ncbi:MAG: hypothetical protein QXP01_00310 [Candidatus Hadarchaeum sp.]
MPQTKYAIADFAVARGILENDYAVDPGGTKKIIPIYDVDVPIQHEQAFETVRFLSGSLAAIGGYPVEAIKRWTFTTYVYNTGDRQVLPPWAELLIPCSGFRKSKITGTAPSGTMNASASGSGVLNGTYYYKVSLVDADDSAPLAGDRDETPASADFPTGGVTATNQKVTVTLPTPPSGKFYRIYRAKGSATNPFYWVADLAPTENSFVDNVEDNSVDFTRTAPVTADVNKTVFTPTSVDHESLYAEFFLNSYKTAAAGSRGTWTLEASYGRALAMRWDMQGLYVPSSETVAANPVTSALGPGMPYRFVSASVNLWATSRSGTTSNSYSGAPQIKTPVVKRVTITPGTQVAIRGDALQASGVIELGIHQTFQPSVTLTVEVDRAFEWNPVADYNAGVDFGLSISVSGGAGSGRSCRFSFPNCQIHEAPRHVREDNGILCWEIAFQPKNIYRDDWMRIELF